MNAVPENPLAAARLFRTIKVCEEKFQQPIEMEDQAPRLIGWATGWALQRPGYRIHITVDPSSGAIFFVIKREERVTYSFGISFDDVEPKIDWLQLPHPDGYVW